MIEEQNLKIEDENDDFVEVCHQLDVSKVFDTNVPVFLSLLLRCKEDIDTRHNHVVSEVNQK